MYCQYLTIPELAGFVSRMNIRLLPLFTALLFTSCEKETELERIKREASQGDPEAQLGLAIIYDTVDGLPEYKADAVKWFLVYSLLPATHRYRWCS